MCHNSKTSVPVDTPGGGGGQWQGVQRMKEGMGLLGPGMLMRRVGKQVSRVRAGRGPTLSLPSAVRGGSMWGGGGVHGRTEPSWLSAAWSAPPNKGMCGGGGGGAV